MCKVRDTPDSLEGDTDSQGRVETPKGDNYLLLVAIDQYGKDLRLQELNNPVRDAERLKEVLLKRYNFQEKDQMLKFLKNDEATLQNISKHLKSICAGNRENDNLIFYFAGHGNRQGFYLNRVDLRDEIVIDYDALSYKLMLGGSGKNELSLDNYLLNKKFRHILFIFDCCYAGSFNFGRGGNTEYGEFSRYALTSCAANEKAADEIHGLPGGSPFSLKFVEMLDSMGCDFSIEDIKKTLNTQIELTTQSKQFIKYDKLNFKMNGDEGEFRFELKEEVKQQWTREQLQHSILENLGFKEQRGNVESTYKPEKNSFNVFSACAETNSTHEILRKVIFRSASKVEEKISSGKKLQIKNPEILDIGEDIWETLYRQMQAFSPFESEPVTPQQKIEIVDWMIGRLLIGISEKTTQHPLEFAPKTIILQGQMSAIKDKILEWCNEFFKLFMEKSKIYTLPIDGNPKNAVNKIVFYFQETKKDKTKIIESIFQEEEVTQKANIVITPVVKKISVIDIDEWLKKLPAEMKNKGKPIQVQDFFPSDQELQTYEFEHSDFFKRIMSCFGISADDSQKIFEELYNQKYGYE